MKIAVTYEGGSIFQHFGKTETFKMYEVEDGKIRRLLNTKIIFLKIDNLDNGREICLC